MAVYLLYIDASPRGEGVSRTLALADAFFAALLRRQPDAKIVTRRVSDLGLSALDGGSLAMREALIDRRAWDAPVFRAARAFQAADSLVIAAPYWDLMFPAALKVYLEHVFIREMTFRYENDAPIGLCRARRALFLTTAGSPVANQNFGADYLRAALAMLGIPRFDSIRAEGLDIAGADVRTLLDEAKARAEAIADSWQFAL